MTRRKAAAQTLVIAAACWAAAWAAERYPTATLAGVSLGTIYLKLRAEPDGDPGPGRLPG